jgi:hypothetical protein
MTATRGGCHLVGGRAPAQTDPLPSQNNGSAKQAIHEFVRPTTDTASQKFVPPEARIAIRLPCRPPQGARGWSV